MAQTKVTKPGIADDAVETTTIKNLNVTAAKLSTDAVETTKIKDLNVTNAKIAAGTIDITAKITGTVPSANLGTGTASSSTILYGDQTYKAEPTTDLTPLRQDIITLALRQGVQENMTKHNLPNSAVVAFQADADFNLAGSTDVSRNTSNYIEATTTTEASHDVDWSYLRTGNATTVSNATWTNALNDNDRATAGSDSSYYTIGLAHTRVFNLNADFNFQSFFVDGSGNRASYDYGNLNVIVSTDTTYAGTEQGPGTIWFDAATNNDTGTTQDWMPSIAQAFTTSVNTALGYSSYALTNVDAGDESTSVDMGSASRDFNMYFNDASNYYGHSIIYDASAGTMTMGAVTDTARTVSVKAKVIATNVPSTGSVFIGEGNSNIVASKWNSLTYASGTGFSTYDSSSTVVNATGTALGTTNVPSSAVTEVSGVMLMKNAYGTNTLGTDVKVYFTADNSNWTEAASYTDSGTFSDTTKQITLGKTTVTSGSDVRWKIEFANQVADTKVAAIYGIGTNY